LGICGEREDRSSFPLDEILYELKFSDLIDKKMRDKNKLAILSQNGLKHLCRHMCAHKHKDES
jgi:hypothetical protein